MPFRPPSDEEIAESQEKDRKKRMEEYARNNPPDPTFDQTKKVRHTEDVYAAASRGMPTGEKDQSYLNEITKPMEQREKEAKRKKEEREKKRKDRYAQESQSDGFEEYRARKMRGEDATMYDIQTEKADEGRTGPKKKNRKEKKSWTEKKLERMRAEDEMDEIRARRKERRDAEKRREIEEKQARTELARTRRESRQSSSSRSSYDDEYDEPAPKKTSKKAIAGAVAADVGYGLLTGGDYLGVTETVTGSGKGKKPRSAPSEGRSTAQRKPKAPQSKPKSRSATSKPKSKGKSTPKKKTPSKAKGTAKKGKGKKKSPPKSRGGMFWDYGDAGL